MICAGRVYECLLCLVILSFGNVSARHEKRHGVSQRKNYTVGIFLVSENSKSTWKSLTTLAQEISDPKSASYGHYLTQAQLTERIGISTSASEMAAKSLKKAMKVLGATANTSEAVPQIVSHRDAVLMTLHDFRMTYQLGQALTENGIAHIWPKNVHMLVTPPMPDGFFIFFDEKECKRTTPCKWKVSKYSPESFASKNHSHKPRKSTCSGNFAGWICWREVLTGLRSEAQWHCFEPANFKGVEPSNSSQEERNDGGMTRRKTAKRRRRGVEVSQLLEKTKHRKRERFHVVAQSGGFRLLTRQNISWESLEITFRQDGLVQNRLLKREDFVGRGRQQHLHMAAVNSLKNLRHVSEMFVCFNMFNVTDYILAPPGQVGCDCAEMDVNDTTSNAWGWDNRLGRDCEKVWSYGPVGPGSKAKSMVLPRAAQSLEALYRDLQVLPPEGQEMGSQAVAQFNDESFLQEDVVHLHRAYGLPRAKTVLVHGKRGRRDTSDTGGEGSLDLQTITSLAPEASTTWWGVDPLVLDGFMLAYTVDVNNHDSPPLVHSISWGDAEALFPPALVQRLDYELMKMSLRGLTVLVASGDNGNSAVGSDCTFVPDVVGASPWVTSVGATMPSLDAKPYCAAEGFREEFGQCEELGQVTCSSANGALITSSGFFSVYRPRPDYQKRAVASFQRSACEPYGVCPINNESFWTVHDLENFKIPCQHIARTGCFLDNLVKDSRAAPDVALPGQSYPVLVNHSVYSFDGTSASAPAFAALISRLNGLQAERGEPPLGLLNPWLYQVHREHPEAFLDVVVGDTASTESTLCPLGFKAGPGWDPATGLGVPRYAALRNYLPRRTLKKRSVSSPTTVLARSEFVVNPTWHLSMAALLLASISGLILMARACTKQRSRSHWDVLMTPFLQDR